MSRTRAKRKYGFILAIAVAMVIVIIAVLILLLSREAAQSEIGIGILNAQEIEDERQEYPYVQLFPDSEDSNVSYMPIPYVNIFEDTDNFIQLEILSNADTYYERLAGNSYSDRVVSYRARVLRDINDEFEEGDEIEIATIEIVDELIPNLIPGKKYVLPLNTLSGENANKRFLLRNLGSYYINDEGFVFSMYDVYDYDIFTGNQVNTVMDKLTLDSKR